MTSKPGTVAEILASADSGATWIEGVRLYAICAVCHLERPTDAVVVVDERWYCPDEVPEPVVEPADEWDVIHAYSRAQAIADGVLVAVPDAIAREAGFRYPVAMTAAAWSDCVEWTDADNRRKDTLQDETGRLWDVLFMARLAIRRAGDTDRVPVRLVRVPREGRGIRPRPVKLVAVCGPGDDAEPVLTLMFDGED
jgi:hypothetical protein